MLNNYILVLRRCTLTAIEMFEKLNVVGNDIELIKLVVQYGVIEIDKALNGLQLSCLQQFQGESNA